MMPIDPSIPLQVQQSSPFSSLGQATQSLSSLAQLQNIQQQGQMFQAETQNLNNSAAQSTQSLNEMNLTRQAMLTGKDPDGNSLKGPDGEIDPMAMANFANKYLPVTGQAVQQSIIQTMDNRLKLNDSVRALGQGYRNDVSGIIRSGIGSADASGVSGGLDAYAKQNPQAAPTIGYAQSLLQHLNPNMPQAQRDQALQHLAMQLQPANTTAQEQAPQIGTTTGSGGGVQAVQLNPYSAVPMGATGPETAQGLSPGEAATRVPTFQNGQPGTVSLGSVTPGSPGYGGGNPFGSGRLNSQPGNNPSFAGSGAPIGTSADVDWMKKDYQGVTSDASTAQQRIGLYNAVQTQSQKALTGPRDRLNYANSLLAMVPGAEKAQDLNQAQVLLNKYGSMIQQAFGGNTDAARAVVAHFTPGSVMPDKVNQEISEYGKANAQMQLFAQHYLQGASNGTDAGAYKDRKSDLAMISDPRLWQFQNMSPTDRVGFLRDMTPNQQQQFGALYKRANALGAFQ
ncbi:hypothetical protein [Paraburkholderia pallida]|uniref:Uncharacterized protein n=1 Tax=Paraburkholderia pallida TaxID=2547399 RepID=A0A4P7CY52_9BURK|nr:hypothetical protein [Paraburkholderia pallida]QBQ99259.1 hypothetical protein E1956_18820 [Paraburkholderia pallida]